MVNSRSKEENAWSMSDFSEVFSHCPRCGSPRFVENDVRSKRCEDCGFIYYLNASAATAAAIVRDGGEILVSRRAVEPAAGTLDLPGGFVEPGESIDAGLRREILEETGCETETAEWLFSLPNFYSFSGLEVPTADSFFLCRLKDGSEPHAGDDAASLEWRRLASLDPSEFGLASIRCGVAKLQLILALRGFF